MGLYHFLHFLNQLILAQQTFIRMQSYGLNLLGIRQKSESHNECYKKTKHAKLCLSRSKKCLFFEKFGALCFLTTSVQIGPFGLLLTNNYCRTQGVNWTCNKTFRSRSRCLRKYLCTFRLRAVSGAGTYI